MKYLWNASEEMGWMSDLEEISERPVAQHLKEGMVVGVFPNIVQVIVFSPSLNELLGVSHTS